MSPDNKSLFLQQINDTYIRENFRRLKFQLDQLQTAGIAGPAGPQGPQGDPGLTQATATPSSGGGTITGGNITLADNRAVKYTILAYNIAEDVTKYQELVVLNTDGTTSGLKNISGFSGGNPINYSISSAISGGDIELTIQNNELFDLQVEITQVLLGNIT